MSLPVYHSQYTAAQIEASIGKSPRINTTTGTWEVWSISTSSYVDTGVQIGKPPDLGHISLAAAEWTGSASPYTQEVAVSIHEFRITANTKLDLQPTAAQIAALISDGVTGLVIENDNGTLTAYAVGAKPSSNMTFQATATEVTPHEIPVVGGGGTEGAT